MVGGTEMDIQNMDAKFGLPKIEADKSLDLLTLTGEQFQNGAVAIYCLKSKSIDSQSIDGVTDCFNTDGDLDSESNDGSTESRNITGATDSENIDVDSQNSDEGIDLQQIVAHAFGNGAKILPEPRTEEADLALPSGYLSVQQKLRVELSDGLTQRLFLKAAGNNQRINDFAKFMNLDAAEVVFYRDIVPDLIKLEIETSGYSYMAEMVPRFSGARFSSESRADFYLLLEDLSPEFATRDFNAGLSEEEVRLVAKNLAYFHAASTALAITHRVNLEQHYGQLSKSMEAVEFDFLTADQQWVYQQLRTRNIFPETEDMERTGKEDRVQRLQSFIAGIKARDLGPPTKCLVHQDIWSNNLLFDAKGENLRIVDFQFLRVGDPGMDIALAILYNLSHLPSIEKAMELACEYYEIFSARLNQLCQSDLTFDGENGSSCSSSFTSSCDSSLTSSCGSRDRDSFGVEMPSSADFLARFRNQALRLVLFAWIRNANLMQKYPGYWSRFVNFLHLTEDMWNPPWP